MTDQDQKPTEAQNQAELDSQEPAIDESTPDTDQGTDDDGQTDEQETPDSQETEEPETFINQEAVTKRINEVIAARHEEKRKRLAIEKELEQTKAKLSEKEKQVFDDIVVPPLPDAFDPEYETKIAIRDAALKKQALAEAQKTLERENKEKAEQQRLTDERNKVKGYVETMYSQGQKLGITNDELRRADDTVAMFIKDPELARYIISHEKAPLIVKTLSDNLEELEKISQMSPISAAAHIASNIVPKARYKPPIPDTPDPLDIPEGRPAGEKVNKWLEGVTFE